MQTLAKPLIKYKLCFNLILLAGCWAQAQTLKGIVVDEQGKPLPFANIYSLSSSVGGTTNVEGKYELELEPGLYDLVFQYIGYKRVVKEVVMASGMIKTLNVKMEPEAYTLKEVVVNAKDRDPAYAVIREAIRKRAYHLSEVNAYNCRVYIKGNQHLDKAPKRIFGFNVPVDTGIVYLSESVSELSFAQPDRYRERMISSKVSGHNNAFSFNMASEMMINFYENLIQVEGVTERGFISPIASNAFFYYDYKLRGTFQEGEYLVNKIEVIPRRKNDPALAGFIYIIEDSWRIHSVDLRLQQKGQIDFVDNLRLKQVYAPLEYGIWMLISQRFDFRVSAMGFEGNGYFVAVFSNYKLEPRYVLDKVDSITGPTAEQVKKLPKNRSKVIANKPGREFSREVLAIEEDANKRDSLYWEAIRPMPLTAYEQQDYRFKDSLLVIRQSKPYRDSIDDRVNNLSLTKLFITGYTYQHSFAKRDISFDPLYSVLHFNSVEGLVTNLNITYTQNFEDNRFYRITPTLRYGFSSEKFYGKLRLYYYFDPKKFTSAQLESGSFISQLNADDPISPLANTYETLVVGRNFMKLYERRFLATRFRTEIANGVLFTGRFHWESRRSLDNTTGFTFFEQNRESFTSNNPENIELADTDFPRHEASILDLSLILQPGQRYISRPDQKVLLINRWPSFQINFKKGISGFLGSDVDYNELSFRVSDELPLGLFGVGSPMFETGFFFGPSRMYFPDYEHFSGNITFLARFNLGNFQLLDYYKFSTRQSYVTVHYEHHFNGFIVNKIPLLRKTKVQAVATVNYLSTPGLSNYTEWGFGLEHILKILRIDFFTSFIQHDHQRTGVKVGLGF